MRIGIDARMCGEKQTGIGIYIENFIKNVLELDPENEYILFCRKLPEKLRGELERYKNVKIVRADYKWYSFSEQIFFPFKIRQEKLDLMHFPHFNAPIFCPVKFVVTIHDLTPKYFPGNKVGKSLFRRKMFDLVMKRTLSKSEKIIAVSNFTKNEILRFYPHTYRESNKTIAPFNFFGLLIISLKSILGIGVGVYPYIPPKKIEVIYEGLREEFFSKSFDNAREYAVSEAVYSRALPPFIFYTGAWRDHKNLAGLIKAFKILKDKYRISHKLVLGGNENLGYLEVRKMWEELGLQNDVILKGFLSTQDQIFLYQNCDLYVSPSFCEGFGFTPLEAMSQGAVVALSDIPAHREISRELPMYFNPQSSEDMAEKIYFALSNADFRQKFASQGVAFARKYQWQDCAMKTLKLYNDIIKVNNI